MHTLFEAFVIVAVVVFLFLGNWRATLIPMIAVPVSVIGTFAVLLAMGYSANTVSLLAMVLAIGIVVDDAIVVVENVERIFEEEPELSPAEATKKAMEQITAPVIAITLVLLSVFVPIAFIPGISGELFRQFAVTIIAAMLLSAVNSLTLSPALCAVLLRHTGERRGIMAWVSRRIDNVRDGYAAIVGKTLRFSILSLALVGAFAAGTYLLSLRTPTGFLPEEDQGIFFVVVQLPDAASVARTEGVVRQVEEILQGMPQVKDVSSVVGYSFLDSFSASNSAFLIATLKPFEDRQGGGGFGAGADRQNIRAGPADPRRRCAALQPAAGYRPVHHRRLRIYAREPAGCRSDRYRRHDARSRRSRQCGPAASARVLDLYGGGAIRLPRHRSGQGAGAGSHRQRRVHDACNRRSAAIT